ncbi:MAG: histidinol dehydrogenase, partial [Proteobacteria bacterium]|nr:histidinol dehydrogenase [Pseudomonadota bacterium]
GARLEMFAVTATEIKEAEQQLSSASIAAIDRAIGNVTRFHDAQKPASIDIETMPGIRCQRVSQPIDSVGLYVPAGSAPLPSAAIMLTVPAAVAGCPERVLCTPPRPDGSADPGILVAARRGGVECIYKIGGAQAIAALAYGTESVPKVNKVFGPGNAWVTAAKTIVAGDPQGAAIDLPAGPTEVLVIADASANSDFVASDLLAQAEHGEDSQVVFVSTDRDLIERVHRRLAEQARRLSRRDIVRKSLQHSRSIWVENIETAIEISNEYAPEHLLLQVDNPRGALTRVRNAGSVFLGPWSPESVGDYCSGTNHVLPTYGLARAYSGLGVEQFLRQMTIQELTHEGLASVASTVIELATLEGLDAHAQAISERMLELGRAAKAS